MKKTSLFIFIMLLLPFLVFSEKMTTHGEPAELSSHLYMYFSYYEDKIQKFKFSDMAASKDGNFEDIFNTPGLDWIKMTTLDSGRLKNDGNLFIHWISTKRAPIDRLTIEIPEPLTLNGSELLDWYAVIDGKNVLGGHNGYGLENASVLYQRDSNKPIDDVGNSVQLNLWTEDITGKKAGNYIGSLVLRVYGES